MQLHAVSCEKTRESQVGSSSQRSLQANPPFHFFLSSIELVATMFICFVGDFADIPITCTWSNRLEIWRSAFVELGRFHKAGRRFPISLFLRLWPRLAMSYFSDAFASWIALDILVSKKVRESKRRQSRFTYGILISDMKILIFVFCIF